MAGAAEGEGDALAAGGATMPEAVEGVIPAAGDNPGITGFEVGPNAGVVPGDAPRAGAPGANAGEGARPGAPGVAGSAELGAMVAPAAGAIDEVGTVAGEPAGGGEIWLKTVSANVNEQREAISSFFIG